jgi:hypothetical protein
MTEDSTLANAGWALSDAAIQIGMVLGLGATLEAVSVPSGAATIITATNIAAVATNVRDPIPWILAQHKWDEVTRSIGYASDDIGGELPNFKKYWEGSGAEAFATYLEEKFLKALEPLKELSTNMGKLCGEAFKAQMIFIGAVIGADVAAIGAMLATLAAAPETLGASLLAQWGIAAGWIAFVSALVGAMWNMWNSIGDAAKEIGTAVDSAAGKFFDNARKLEGNRLKPDYEAVHVDTNWSQDEWFKAWGRKGELRK